MVGRRDALKAARKAAGHTLESLAEAVGVDRSTVIRWESGQSEPQPPHRPKLASDLKVSLARLDVLLLATDETREPQTAERPSTGSEITVAEDDRVDYVLCNPRSVDLITVATLREHIRELDRSYESTPSAQLIGQAAQWLGHIMLLKGYAAGRVVIALLAAEAEAAILVGQLAWDASQRREPQAATLYFEQARTAGRQIRDPAIEGLALLRQSFVALYGERDPYNGLSLASQAAQTGGATSSVIAGLGLLHTAEAHAMLGQRRECELALAEADGYLAQIDVADPARELFSSTQPGRLAGSCYLALGQERRAQRILEDTARDFDHPSKNQAIVWGNLGLAHLRQNELDQAAAALHRAIDVIETTRGGGGLNIVFDAARELHAWRQLPVVGDLQDRLLTLMTAA
jgi:transcriptional regulator with XRE-family HTH domain/tetratricopeptide (TPR) repeat protein